MAKFPSKVLLIDNDQSVMNRIEAILAKKKIPVVKAPNVDQALYHYNQNKIDLVLTEKELQDVPGPVLIQKFRCHDIPSKRNPAIIISQASAIQNSEANLVGELGQVVLIKKPVKEASLMSFIVKAMENAQQRSHLHQIRTSVIDPLLEAKEWDKAAMIAEQKLMAGNSASQFLASETLEQTEHFERSLEITRGLYKEEPRNLSYINQIARLQMKTGNFDQAKEFYEKADSLAPHNLSRVSEMADLYLQMNLPDHSIDKYRELLKFNPENPDLKYDFFRKLQEHGFEKEAQDFCQETTSALELIRHYNNKGVMYSKQQLYIDAIDEYDKARRLIPQSKELYRILYNMAIAHINLKDLEHIQQANQLLEEVLSIKPDYDKAHGKLEITQKYLKSKKGA